MAAGFLACGVAAAGAAAGALTAILATAPEVFAADARRVTADADVAVAVAAEPAPGAVATAGAPAAAGAPAGAPQGFVVPFAAVAAGAGWLFLPNMLANEEMTAWALCAAEIALAAPAGTHGPAVPLAAVPGALAVVLVSSIPDDPAIEPPAPADIPDAAPLTPFARPWNCNGNSPPREC